MPAASASLAGKPVTVAHPNLRKRTDLAFVPYEKVGRCDVLFLSLPTGSHRYDEFADRARVVVDLSSDHRLRSAADYERWYEGPHPHPERLGEFVYGIPELHRPKLVSATRLTGAGCNATAAILALLPLFRADVVDRDRPIVVEAKVGHDRKAKVQSRRQDRKQASHHSSPQPGAPQGQSRAPHRVGHHR